MRGTYQYRVFGLTIRSELPLPELFSAVGDAAADVEIVRGPLAGLPNGPYQLGAIQGGIGLAVDGVARFAIYDGRRIVIDADEEAAIADVRLYLLGSAMGVLLHQRGLVPLHANAVEIDGRAFAFMGHSGSGKSTLAAWFHERGYRIIADDVCVIQLDGAGQPLAVPGLPRLRLWREALDHFGLEAANYRRSFSGVGGEDKFDVPIAHQGAASAVIPLAGLFQLASGGSFELSRLEGIASAEAVYSNVYRGQHSDLAGNTVNLWRACMRIIEAVPVSRVERPRDLSGFDRQCDQLLEVCRTAAVAA